MDDADTALLELLRALEVCSYSFVTPTPATHARVVARPDRRQARDLADVFGWSLPFAPGVIGPDIEWLADRAALLTDAGGALRRSSLRVSALRGHLFLHSAYPTDAQDAVFFGPDSYRFADFIAAELDDCPPGARVVDIGAGSGVGAITAADLRPGAHTTMTDINPAALRLARINAAHADIEAEFVETNVLDGVGGEIDVILANPPYIADEGRRAYRDGGEMLGAGLSLDMARAGLAKLSRRGRMLLYTGSAIVRGEDALADALGSVCAEAGCVLRYRELDPDVFGEELERRAYADVDRIAAVGAVITREE